MIIDLILRCLGIKRHRKFDPDERLRSILIANKHKFHVDRDGVLHVNIDHPEVKAAMRRLMTDFSKVKTANTPYRG